MRGKVDGGQPAEGLTGVDLSGKTLATDTQTPRERDKLKANVR